jgi:multidrug resistance protein, MATE family
MFVGIRTNILKRTRSTYSDQNERTQLRRTVFSLGLPAVGEQLLNLLVGLVDTFLVGHLAAGVAAQLGYGSAQALAAVGIAGYVVWTATTLFIAVAVGATALIARSVGAGRADEANSALRQSVWLSVLMGVLTMAAVIVAAPLFVRMLGAPADVQPLAASFLRITALSMPLAALLFVGNAALRGVGDTRTPLLLMLIVNGLNVVIAWLLVNGQWGLPALGVDGTAWGAAIARGVGGVLVVLVLVRGRGMLRLDRFPMPQRTMMGRLLRVGLPAGAENGVPIGADRVCPDGHGAGHGGVRGA